MEINKKNLLLIIAIIILICACIYSVYSVSSIIASKDVSDDFSPSDSAKPSTTPNVTPSPSDTPTPKPEPITATLISAGDCVLHDLFRTSALTEEDEYDFYPIFEGIKPYTEPASYSLISFESAATNKRNDYSGYPLFNCPPEIFDAFKKVGLDMVNNSNNHQLDRKLSGMFETRDNINKAGLEVSGIYDGEEPRYIIKDLNGIKVAIMAYTYSCNMNELSLSPDERYNHLALIDEERMEKEIKEMESKADITVVAMHWGVEYTQKPNDTQKKLASDMVSWGADVIFGSHPHVVQPSEIINHNGEDKYVIYSMGNFVSNQRRGASGYPKTHKELCEDSMLVHIEFLKDPETQKTVIQKVDHIPTWLWRYQENNTYKFKVIPVPQIDYYQNGEYPKEVLTKANESYKRTMSLVTDYQRQR